MGPWGRLFAACAFNVLDDAESALAALHARCTGLALGAAPVC